MVDELLRRIAQALDRERIAHMVIGGQAAIRWGRVRFTEDIDVRIQLPCYQPDGMLALIKELGLEPKVPQPRQLILMAALLPCYDPVSGFGVDFAFHDSPYDQQAFAAAQPVSVAGYPVRFTRLEDMFVQKVIAWRGVDQEDLRFLAEIHPELDRLYVRRWLSEFETLVEAPLLERFESLMRAVD